MLKCCQNIRLFKEKAYPINIEMQNFDKKYIPTTEILDVNLSQYLLKISQDINI